MVDIPISNATVFPEDRGTGAPYDNEGDFGSAAHFATLAVKSGTGSYIEDGLRISATTDGSTASITSGLSFLRYGGELTVQDHGGNYDESWPNPSVFLASLPSVLDISLDAGAVNEVWLALDLTGGDSAYYRVGDEAVVSQPPEPSVLLGTIDTTVADVSADGITELNREPDGDFDEIDANVARISGSLTLNGDPVLTEGDMATIDADTLDGYEGADFSVLSEDETITGTRTIENSTVSDNILTLRSTAGATNLASLLQVVNADGDAGLTLVNGTASQTWQWRTSNGGDGMSFTKTGSGGSEFSIDNTTTSYANATGSIGGSRILTTSDEGSLDAGTLDGLDSTAFSDAGHTHGEGDLTFDPATQLELDDRVTNQRTLTIESGSEDEYLKLATISNGSSNQWGDVYVKSLGGTPNNPGVARTINFYSSVGQGNNETGWYIEGNGTSRLELLLVEETVTNGTNKFHLYAHAPSWVEAYVVVKYSASFGGIDFQTGLTQSDVTAVGTIVHSTADSPQGYHSFGSLYSEGNPVLSTADEGSLDAGTLDGLDSGQFIRSDVDDTFDGVPFFGAIGTITGTLGNSSGEVWRTGGGASDLLLDIQGGHGRVARSWNAYYDNTANSWKAIAGGEGASLIRQPSPGDQISLEVSSSTPAAAGDSISFDSFTVASSGPTWNGSALATESYVDNNSGGGGSSVTIDVVEAGATRLTDTTGRPNFTGVTAVNKVIEDEIAALGQNVNNHIKFIIPEGAYLWDANRGGQQGRLEIDTMGTVEIIGEGLPRLYLDKNVTLVDTSLATPEATGLPHDFIEIGDAGTVNDIRIENLNFVISDWAGDPLTPALTNDGYDVDASLGRFIIEKNGIIKNVYFTGRRHRYQDVSGDGTVTPGEADEVGGRYNILPVVRGDSGQLTIEHLHMDHGGIQEGTAADQVGHAIGIGAETAHNGKITIRDSSVQHFVDNGYYVKAPNGRIVVESCYAENNSNSNYRGAGQATFRDCELVFDATDAAGVAWGDRTTAGFTLEHDGSTAVDTIKVEDCYMDVRAPMGTGSPSIVQVTGGTAHAEILNNECYNNGNENTFCEVKNYTGTGTNAGATIRGNYFKSENANATGHPPNSNHFVYTDRWKTQISDNYIELGANTDWKGIYIERDRCHVTDNFFTHGSGATATFVTIAAGRRDNLIAHNEVTDGRIHVLGDQNGPLMFLGNNFDDAPTHQFDGTVEGDGNADEPSGWEYAANIGLDGTTASWNNA